MEGGGVVGGWTEIKRMNTRETRLYMPFVSPQIRANKAGSSKRIIAE